MIEIGYRACLGQSCFGVFRFGNQFCVRHFHSHATIQLLVMSQIDYAKAPFAKHLLDPIPSNPLRMFSNSSVDQWDRILGSVLSLVVRVDVIHKLVISISQKLGTVTMKVNSKGF